MTQTSLTKSHEAGADPVVALSPTDILMNLIITFLVPLFLSAGNNDIYLARVAAIETVNAYRARNQADLIAIAQIIAFGLAALGSLSLSLADDISINMALRLRGNANSLNRSAEQNRRALRERQAQSDETTEILFTANDQAVLQAAVATTQQAAAEARTRSETQAASPTETQNAQAAWAAGMNVVAAEITAGLSTLPPVERREAAHRAAVLTNTANTLLAAAGTAPRLPSIRHIEQRTPALRTDGTINHLA